MSGLRIILKRNFDMVDVNAHFYLGTFWGFSAINGMMPALQARHEQEYQAFLQK